MPGGSFKKWAKPWTEEAGSLLYNTYNLSKKKIVSHFLPSFAIVGMKAVTGARNCHNIVRF
jgi:hypothetical protein